LLGLASFAEASSLDLLFLIVLPSELLFAFGLEVEPWSESKLASEISAFIVLMGFVILWVEFRSDSKLIHNE
jgi:hypothetical protein